MVCPPDNIYITTLLWVSLGLYLFSIIPQILLNMRLKSVAGLSDTYLYAFFLGYITDSFYVLCLDFHPAYTYLVPIAGLCIGVVVLQRFFYHSPRLTPRLFALYVLTTLIAIALIPLSLTHKHMVGHGMGWIATSLWSTYQLPQIAKNFFKKSVHGFSFGLTIMIGVASLLECVGTVAFKLPLQSTINAFRGVCMFLIFSYQFMLYKTKSNENTIKKAPEIA